MKKMVDGVEVEMSAKEEAAVLADWQAAKEAQSATSIAVKDTAEAEALREKLGLSEPELELLAKLVRGA